MMISYKLSIEFEFGLSAKQSSIAILFSLKHSFVDFAAWRRTRRCWIIYSLSWNLSSMRDNVIIWHSQRDQHYPSVSRIISFCVADKPTATIPHRLRELRYFWSGKLSLYLPCDIIYTQGGRWLPEEIQICFLLIYEHDLLQLISRTASTDEQRNYLF